MSDALLQAMMMSSRRRADPVERQRAFADSMIRTGTQTTPVGSPMEGLARAVQAGLGGFMAGRADEMQKEKSTKGVAALSAAMSATNPAERAAAIKGLDPDNEFTMPMLSQMLTQQVADERAQARLTQGVGQLGAGYGMPPQPQGGVIDRSAQATAGIESNGQPNGGYGAIGPVANKQGHRAYGKYQVLEPNVGPWTQEVVGRPMTPQEFLADSNAQEAVYKAKMGQYIQQYGSPEAASRAWFAGPGGMNNPNATDVNGMSVQRYGQKFAQAYGPGAGGPGQVAGPQVGQGAADPSGTPTQQQPPQVPDVPRPQPTPEQLARHQQILQQGGYGQGAEAVANARKAIEGELDRDWQVQREMAGKRFSQQQEDFNYNRKRSDEAPKQQFDQEGQLRDKFAAEPPVKSFRAVVPMLEAARKAGPSRAGDLNLVYAFAKMMDPDSVVRESETAGVVATASVADRLQGYIGQLNGQPMLTPEVRAKLMKELETRYQALQTSHDELKNQYGQIAQSYGLTPERVTLGVRPAAQPQAGPAPAQPQQQGAPARISSDADYDALPPGATFIAPDGTTRRKQ